MELVSFIAAVAAVGFFAYFTCTVLFLSLTARPFKLALSLSWKLPAVSLLGAPLFGVGGVVLASVVFVTELRKLPCYSPVRDIAAAIFISILCSAFTLYCTVLLAFEILE